MSAADACLAAALVAVAGPVAGGARVRAGAGPGRDAWLAALRGLLRPEAPVGRLPPGIGADRLLGGLDPVATLRAGRPVMERGVLATVHGGILVAPMAERLDAAAAGILAATLDTGRWVRERDGTGDTGLAQFVLVALDEAEPGEDGLAAVLAERIGMDVALEPTSLRDSFPPPVDPETVARARELFPAVHVPDAALEACCGAAAMLGIDSLRAPLYAAAVARAHAALRGRDEVDADDLAAAARLVLAPRATRLPAEPEADAPPPGDAAEGETADPGEEGGALADRIVEAAAAAVPAGMLDRITGGSKGGGRRGAAGARSLSSGRSAGVRPGLPRGGARLAVLETLRAAAPWQRLRAASPKAASTTVRFRPEDLRIRIRRRRPGVTIVFAVDASGSAAAHRLAEAKGAVEVLLAESYVRRDRVALVAFRDRGADLALPPTRALARARRLLAGLPGGGATPLAAGLDLARVTAEAQRRSGDGAAVVVLTDGRANIGRDGSPGRAAAEADARASATAYRSAGIPLLVLDTARRPSTFLRDLAGAAGGRWTALPVADPHTAAAHVRALSADARAAAST